MEVHYFLLAIGILWSIFAIAVDFKKREVPNWLNFSLIAFALAYRAFYSAFSGEEMFLISGLVGFGIFFGIAHLFYYLRVFAGGDAKLLMGFGVILPYSNFSELSYIGVLFIFALFLLGSIYSLVYSSFIVGKNWGKFKREFRKIIQKSRGLLIGLIIVLFSFLFIDLGIILDLFLILTFLLYVYVKALDICLIVEKKARELQEGDWLEKDVKLNRGVIRKSVHGLSLEDIKMLMKARKKVLIREGIPFTPAFLLSLLIMAPFFSALQFHFWFFSLF